MDVHTVGRFTMRRTGLAILLADIPAAIDSSQRLKIQYSESLYSDSPADVTHLAMHQ